MQNFLQKIKPWWPVIIKSLLIILAICGLVASFKGGDFMSSSMLLYFTIQSNIWIAAIAAVFIVFDVQRILNKRESVANVWYIVKFTFTVAITLTFLVFSLMLTPWMISLGQAAYLTSLSNICLHNAVPILAMLDFFLFDFKFKTNKKSFLYGAIMPIYYLIFALICSFSGVDFGRGAKVPYFFLDYEANGWFNMGNGQFGVVYWIIILTAAVLAYSKLFTFLKDKRAVAEAKKQGVLEPENTEDTAA